MYCSNQFLLQISLPKNETILEVAFRINVTQMWSVSDQQDQQKIHCRQTETLPNLQQVWIWCFTECRRWGRQDLIRASLSSWLLSRRHCVLPTQGRACNTAGLPKPTRSGLLLVQAWEGGSSIVPKPTGFSKSDAFTTTEKKTLLLYFLLPYHTIDTMCLPEKTEMWSC